MGIGLKKAKPDYFRFELCIVKNAATGTAIAIWNAMIGIKECGT